MKTHIQFLLLSIGLIGSSSAGILTGDLTNGLTAYYQFDGNYLDSSSNSNDLTTLQDVSLTTDRFGNANSALVYDSIQAVAISANQSGITGNQARSISLCFNPNSSSYTDLVSFGSYPSTDYPWPGTGTASLIGANSGDGSVHFWGQANNYSAYSGGYNVNAWHNLVFTYGGSVSGASFYLDGQLISSHNVFSIADVLDTPNSPIRIGTRDFSASGVYLSAVGTTIDDTMVWNRALSSTEVSQLYSLQIVPEPSTYALFGMGSVGMLIGLYRKKTKTA